MNIFNEQDIISLKKASQKHKTIRKEIDSIISFLMETKNNIFILEHKKKGSIIELDNFDSYEDIFSHHKLVIKKFRNIFFGIATTIFIILILIFGFSSFGFIIHPIISIIIASFFTFGSKERDYSNDILILLKKQEKIIKKLYQLKKDLKNNAGNVWDVAGEKIINFIHSQSMVSVDFIKEQFHGLIDNEIIELILDQVIDTNEYEVVEVADLNNANKKTVMYKSKVAKNITTTHLQID